MKIAALMILLTALSACGQTSGPVTATNAPPAGQVVASTTDTNRLAVLQHIEAVRAECIQGRRSICGKILKILPDGLIIESGYTDLLRPPLASSWLVPGTVVAHRDSQLIEASEPASVCSGLVCLINLPKLRGTKPALYDYVVLQGYPAGQKTYTSVGTVQRTVRRFSVSLEGAVRLKLEAEGNLPEVK